MEVRRIRTALVVAAGVSLLAPPIVRAVDVDIPIPAKVHLAKVDKNDGTAKLAKVVGKPELFANPTPGGPADPTVHGASLRFCKLSAPLGECTPINLPSAQWKGLGKVPGSKGYKYKGAGSTTDPCKVVIIKHEVVKAVCKGPGALDAPDPFSLPIGPAGVGWELVINDLLRYCMESSAATGATVKKDDPAKGVWKAIKASAPLECFAAAPTPTPTPTPPATPTPTPPYGSASRAFFAPSAGLLQ